MELYEAMAEGELSIFRDPKEREAHRIIMQAAKDMQIIAEAREKATGGEWAQSSCNRIHGNKHYLIASNIDSEDRDFITTAANIAAKYTGGGE